MPRLFTPARTYVGAGLCLVFFAAIIVFEVMFFETSEWRHVWRLGLAWIAGYAFCMFVWPKRVFQELPVDSDTSESLAAAQEALEQSNRNFDHVIAMLAEMREARHQQACEDDGK